MLLAVEESPITFENFREKAALLRRVRYGAVQHYLPKEFIGKFEQVSLFNSFERCLHFQLTFSLILAQFYENLADYWPLVTEIAASYAKSESGEYLWSSFQSLIEYATEHIQETKPSVLPKFGDAVFDAEVKRICEESNDARVNFWSFRLELFRLLSTKFVALAERKHRFLIDGFFNFYEWVLDVFVL